MIIEKASNPWLSLSHMIFTIVISGGFLNYVNAVENKQVELDTRQQTIIDNQKEFKKDFKDYKKEQDKYQKEQTQLLYEIRSGVNGR